MVDKKKQDNKKKRGIISRILDFAGTRRPLTIIGCVLVAISMVFTMMPYVFIWLVVRDLIAVAPKWGKQRVSQATGGWLFGLPLRVS